MGSAINIQFLKAFLITAIAGSLINLTIDSFTSSTFTSFLIADIVACLSPIVGYILFKTYKSEKLVMVFMSALLVPAMVYQFFLSAGYLNGIHITVITMLGYMSSLILKSRIRLVFHCIFFSLILALAVYQCFYIEAFNYNLTRTIGSVIGSAVPFLIIYIIISFSSALLKDKYDQSTNKLTLRSHEINKRNKKIALQNDDLHYQKEELNVLNNNLEELVKQRTEKLRTKNEQLIDYSFKNAHNVRGSLARILGLVYLNTVDSDVSKDEILHLIGIEANEMDQMLRQISKDLYKEIDK